MVILILGDQDKQAASSYFLYLHNIHNKECIFLMKGKLSSALRRKADVEFKGLTESQALSR